MSNMNCSQYFVDPASYLLCRSAEQVNDISFVVVEDDPGPYESFLQDVVEEDLCSMALGVPFSGEAIRLLLGESVNLGEDNEVEGVCLPNPAHCVAILDVRNTTEQTFPGYDPSQPELAGYQFFKQLRGFPGKVFFATRYGTEQLQAKGSGYGIVPLLKEPYDHGPLSESDTCQLRAALDNALVQVGSAAQINRIVNRGSTVEITYHGQICTPPAKREIMAFAALVQSGPDGLSAQELADAVGYKPRLPKAVQDQEEDLTEDAADMTPEALLVKLLDMIGEGQVDDVTAADVTSIRTALKAKKASPEALIRQTFAVCAEKSPDFSHAALIALLSGGGEATALELDRTDRESMSIISELEQVEVITPDQRRRYRQNYISLNYKVLPELQSAEARLLAKQFNEAADGYAGVVASIDAAREQEAKERKKAVQDADSHKLQLEQLKKKISELGQLRDQYYRMGVKCVPVKNAQGNPVSYRVPKRTAPPDDAMRKLKERMLTTLRKQCLPPPADLIQHVDACWIRDSGTYRYTGDESWTVVGFPNPSPS